VEGVSRRGDSKDTEEALELRGDSMRGFGGTTGGTGDGEAAATAAALGSTWFCAPPHRAQNLAPVLPETIREAITPAH
jgi:hypothetical protein